MPQLNLHTIGAEPFDIGHVHFIPIEVLHYKLPVLNLQAEGFYLHN